MGSSRTQNLIGLKVSVVDLEQIGHYPNVNSEEFRIRHRDIPEDVQNRLGRAVGDFSIPIVLDWQFLGSGTLIQFGDTRGILTAEHVVRHPTEAARRIDTSINSKQRLFTTIAEHPHELMIPARYLELRATERESDLLGPDLAFIKIPPGPFLNAIAARKSFVNVSVNPEQRFKEAMDTRGCIVFSGFPDEARFRDKPELGFQLVNGLLGVGFITSQDKRFEQGRHDYIEVGVSRKKGLEPPATFKGVSGGGLWRVPIVRKETAKTDTDVDFGDFRLAGVVFHESDPNEYQTIRAHGPVSLYKVFFPALTKQFG